MRSTPVDPRAAPGEPRRDVGGAAAELDHVLARDVAEQLHLGLGHLEDPPGDLVGSPSCARRRGRTRPPTRPRLPVAGRVLGQVFRHRQISSIGHDRAHSVSSACGTSSRRPRAAAPRRAPRPGSRARGTAGSTRRRAGCTRSARPARRRSGASRSTAASAGRSTCAVVAPAAHRERRRVREREQPARPQQPRRLGHGQVRVAEGHRRRGRRRRRRSSRPAAAPPPRAAWTSGKSTPRPPSAHARARAAGPSCRDRRRARRAPRAGSTTAPRRSRARARPCPATSPRIPSSESGSCHIPQRGSSFRPMNAAFRAWYSSLRRSQSARLCSAQTSHRRRTRARPRARPTRASPSRGRGCPASRARGRRGSCPAASRPGSSTPIVDRTTAIAPSPSSTSASVGAEVMNSTSSPKNGFSACSA